MAAPETPDVIVSNMEGPKGDTVSATVQGAVDAATAHFLSHQGDTYGQGSTIGTTVNLPEVPAYTQPPPPVGGYPWQGDEPVDTA